jgi:hypothetical protein
MKHIPALICFLAFWSFVTIKVGGVALAAWSWWWILLPIVPTGVLVVKHFGL